MGTSRKKRMCLLSYAREGLDLKQVNARLVRACLEPINDLDWNLWMNHYLPIVENNLYFEKALVDQNRSLAWFARQMHNRKKKTNLS
jgi:hypothetical protein